LPCTWNNGLPWRELRGKPFCRCRISEVVPYLSSCGFESIVAGFLRKSPSAKINYLGKKVVMSMGYGGS